MDHSKILEDLHLKQYAPIYFLHGDESYFIDQISDYIEHNVLDEGEKSFNQIVLYGKETEFKQVLDQAMQYPMMAPYRVVILKEAQSMNGLDKLADYFSNPAEQTILVIAHKHKKFDKRKKKAWDALKKNAVILETKKMYDNQIPGFISNVSKSLGIKIDNKAAYLLAEHLGNDLSKISNELEKLKLNLADAEEISLDHIQKYIGISKDYNMLELQASIGRRDKLKAYSIAKYFSENKKAHPIQRNIASLYYYFSVLFMAKKFERADDKVLASKARINPYFVRDYKAAARNYSVPQIKRAFRLLHDMDKSSKGVEVRRATDLGIYQEFLFKLFAA